MVPNNDIWGAAREVLAVFLIVHFKVHKERTFFLTCDVLLIYHQRAKEQQRISSHPLPKNRRHSNYRSTSPVWLWNVKKICITNRVLEEPCRTTINKCIKNTQEEGLFASAVCTQHHLLRTTEKWRTYGVSNLNSPKNQHRYRQFCKNCQEFSTITVFDPLLSENVVWQFLCYEMGIEPAAPTNE